VKNLKKDGNNHEIPTFKEYVGTQFFVKPM